MSRSSESCHMIVLNESWHVRIGRAKNTWVSHVTIEWVMSRSYMNESCMNEELKRGMSHVTIGYEWVIYEWVRHVWIGRAKNIWVSHVTIIYEWVVYEWGIRKRNESCHNRIWMSHVWMRNEEFMNEEREWGMSHVTIIYELVVYEWGMSHIWMRMRNESFQDRIWMSRIWMRNESYMNADWVMSRSYMNEEWVMSRLHISEECRSYMNEVEFLKSRLTTESTIQYGWSANFWEMSSVGFVYEWVMSRLWYDSSIYLIFGTTNSHVTWLNSIHATTNTAAQEIVTWPMHIRDMRPFICYMTQFYTCHNRCISSSNWNKKRRVDNSRTSYHYMTKETSYIDKTDQLCWQKRRINRCSSWRDQHKKPSTPSASSVSMESRHTHGWVMSHT